MLCDQVDSWFMGGRGSAQRVTMPSQSSSMPLEGWVAEKRENV